jgi:prefoldin subunit 5
MAKNQRLNATVTIGGVVENSFRKGIGFVRSGFDKVGQSIRDVKERQKELSRTRKDLEKQGKSVEHLDREYEALERTLEDLARKQRRWERAMRDSARVGKTFGDMTQRIGRLARQSAIGITAVGAGIFALTSSTASYGDQVAKTAGKLGIGIEALQEYRYAAERSGVSTETFDSSLTAMQKRLGEAAQGTGAAKKALDQIGLSASDLIAMGPERAMGAIADKLQGIEAPAERAAIAAALFSRSGIGMVNMLGNGSDALEQLREDARRTGYVLSEEAARDAEAFADAQLDAQLTIKGLKNTIGSELMPVVTRSMQRFSEWAVTNRDDVAAFADTAATKLEAALPVIGQIAEGMGDVSKAVGGVISKTAEMVGGWKNFGIVVGTVLAGRTIASVLNFGWAVGRLGVSMAALVPWGAAGAGAMKLFAGGLALVKTGVLAVGRALLMNPIGLAVAGIAGSAYLIYENWEKVGPWFAELWDGVKGHFGGLGRFVSGVWRGDMDAAAAGLSDAWGSAKAVLSTVFDGITGVFRFAWENGIKPITDKLGITSHITAAWNIARTMIGTAIGEIGVVLETAYDGSIGPVIEALGATGGISAAWEEVKTAVGAVIEWLAQKFDWLMEKLQPVLDGLSWLRDKGAGAVAGIQGIGDSISNGVSNLFGGGDSSGDEGPANPRSGRAKPIRISGSYLGGTIGRGFREVGEQGPETIWTSKGGYVAHANATERLARLSERAGPVLDALGAGLHRAMAGAQQAVAPVLQRIEVTGDQMQGRVASPQTHAAQAAPVVIHAQIHAGSMSPQSLIDELERRGREAQAGALYDQAHNYGQYGGA